MMQPPSAIAEPIVVNLTPPEVEVAAGGDPVDIVANIRNAGPTVDQYSIEVENLDPSWYTISVQSVSLFPGDSAPIPIKLHPPKTSNTRAGRYTFVVRARSHADPTLVGVTKGVVQVGSYSIFHIELAPKRVTAYRGKFNLNLANGGNNEVQLGLTGRDPESTLQYSFRKSEPTVPAGSKLVVPVRVKSKGMHLIGEPKKYQFVITATPTDGTEKDAKEVQGEFVQRPPLKGWRRPLLGLVALFLLMWLVFAKPDFCLLPQPVGGWVCTFGSFATGIFRPPAAEKAGCQSGPGFTEVRTSYKDQIGGCIEDEWRDPLNNAHQKTQKGQLLYIDHDAAGNAVRPIMYFFGNDNKIYTFQNCKPGTFQDCKVEEVKKP